jgi:hypothetical protein
MTVVVEVAAVGGVGMATDRREVVYTTSEARPIMCEFFLIS